MRKELAAAIVIIVAVFTALGIGIWVLAKEELIPQQKIALIRIEGPITAGKAAFYGGTSSGEVVKLLKEAREDPSIKAIVIRVNSPGGSAAASQEIYREILRVRESGKPVVVSIGDIATSGGYYVASAADKIIAEPGALTGSIGTIITIPQLAEFFERLGIRFLIVKSGEYKDLTLPLRDIKPEEVELLQQIVKEVHEQFIQDVARGRGMSVEKIHEIADGRILTGKQAMEYGLIDEYGNLNDAIRVASELAGVERPVLVELKKRTFWEVLFERFAWSLSRAITWQFEQFQQIRV